MIAVCTCRHWLLRFGKNIRFLFLAICFSFVSVSLSATEIRFLYMSQAGYQPLEILNMARLFEEQSGYTVKVLFPEYEERYSLIKAASQAGAAERYDVLLVDNIWMAEFAHQGLLLPLPESNAQRIRTTMLAETVPVFDYQGRLWAYPFQPDFHLLFTNKTILNRLGYQQPPDTLEELQRMAAEAKAQGLLRYPIFSSWGAYEALVCDYTYYLAAFGGSYGAEEALQIDSPSARQALAYMKQLLDQGLVNPLSLQAKEAFVKQVFCAGDALFVSNWTYLLDFADREDSLVRGAWMVSRMPVSQKLKATGQDTLSICGFEGLAVSSNSLNPQVALDFIEFLVSSDFLLANPSYPPVLQSVWEHPLLVEHDPYLALKREQLENIVVRPALVNYKQFSQLVQNYLQAALRGRLSIAEALTRAQADWQSGQ